MNLVELVNAHFGRSVLYGFISQTNAWNKKRYASQGNHFLQNETRSCTSLLISNLQESDEEIPINGARYRLTIELKRKMHTNGQLHLLGFVICDK